MTRLEDRQTLARTIAQARAEGARLSSACALAGIDARTLQHAGSPAVTRPHQGRCRRTAGPMPNALHPCTR